MCGFGKTSEKEERVKMQKVLQKLSELSLSVGIGVCQMSDEFFFFRIINLLCCCHRPALLLYQPVASPKLCQSLKISFLICKLNQVSERRDGCGGSDFRSL